MQCLLLNANPSATGDTETILNSLIGEAREVPKKGYMARMKKMWDELPPELNHFTEKNLRQQATYIEKRAYLLRTANVTNSNTENSNVGESNNIEVTETIDDRNYTETSPLEQTCHVKLTDADNELLQKLQKRFLENIEKYKLFDNRE